MSNAQKKNNYSINYNLSKGNESSTVETIQQKIEIDDSIYEHFIQSLTISKFEQFSYYCKEKEIENLKHDMKLRKFQFFQIMKNVFPGVAEFYPLYEKIFNRFRLLKCKLIYNSIYDNYFINSIYSNEEIDIYEISCALACFIKCFFHQKMQILFDLTDSDEDGFINEIEVKKMIYTVNYLFNREQNSIGSDSNITYLSLASIKAKKSLDLIMGHPGNLSSIIQKEKYISFENFITAVECVYNYKYNLMPLFVSLKASLNINRNEKELEINKNNFNDYSKILKDIFSGYRKGGYIGTSNYDFKTNLELEKIKKRRFNNKNDKKNNNSQLKTGNLIMNSNYSSLGTLSNANNNSSIFGNSSQRLESYNGNNSININNQSKKNSNLRYNIYYNKICGLEAFPAKFKEIEKDFKEFKDYNNQNQNQIKITKKKTLRENKKDNLQGYMSLVEILDEIGFLINKQKMINSEGIELARDWNEIQEQNTKFKESVKGRNVMISVTTLKPYIFEDIFQKQLKEIK